MMSSSRRQRWIQHNNNNNKMMLITQPSPYYLPPPSSSSTSTSYYHHQQQYHQHRQMHPTTTTTTTTARLSLFSGAATLNSSSPAKFRLKYLQTAIENPFVSKNPFNIISKTIQQKFNQTQNHVESKYIQPLQEQLVQTIQQRLHILQMKQKDITNQIKRNTINNMMMTLMKDNDNDDDGDDDETTTRTTTINNPSNKQLIAQQEESKVRIEKKMELWSILLHDIMTTIS